MTMSKVGQYLKYVLFMSGIFKKKISFQLPNPFLSHKQRKKVVKQYIVEVNSLRTNTF